MKIGLRLFDKPFVEKTTIIVVFSKICVILHLITCRKQDSPNLDYVYFTKLLNFDFVMKRKIYDQLLLWKSKRKGRSAMMIEGARRVGKSYIVKEFAQREYKSYILIDFFKVGDYNMLQA